MPNKHLEHPEDLILLGTDPNEVLDHLFMVHKLTTKWDGAPSIVFGKHHTSGRFFVGTKSVFNKRMIKINYSVADIVSNHEGAVAQILTACFYALPRIEGIVQADFIGFGGSDRYCPNTITYKFPSILKQDVIIAPHTAYNEVSPTAVPIFGVKLPSTDTCYCIDTETCTLDVPFKAKSLIQAARLLVPFCKFPTSDLRSYYNKFVREGKTPTASEIYFSLPDKYKCEVNINTFRLYNLILNIKDNLLAAIKVDETVEYLLSDQPTTPEGFVLIGPKYSVKLVNRLEFSQANFNLRKNWKHEKV
tara:strand:- start:924 stop:1835 length:912 start_codon:yes stop_codon:yes gene_type:complete